MDIKNKYFRIISTILLVFFSFLLAFTFMAFNKKNIKLSSEKELELIMKKEHEVLKNLATYNASTSTYEINSKDNFNEFRNLVNSGTTFSGMTVNLNTDIDFSDETFVPVGTIQGTATASPTYFKGTFNGNNLSLKNINITTSKNAYGDLGVFGYVKGDDTYNATIRDLVVTIDKILLTTHEKNAGGLIGSCSGKTSIFNVIVLPNSSSSEIYTWDTNSNSSMTIGGVVGCVESAKSIIGCANYVNVSNNAKKTAIIGGVFGRISENAKVNPRACYSECKIIGGDGATENLYAGGIVGKIDSSSPMIDSCISNVDFNISYNVTTKTTSPDIDTGYIIHNEDEYRDKYEVYVEYALKYSFIQYNAPNYYIGGIVGYGSDASVLYCISYSKCTSVPLTESLLTLEYFYGRYGDSIRDLFYNFYGDHVFLTLHQYENRYADIGYACAVTNCFSYRVSGFNYALNITPSFRKYACIITGINSFYADTAYGFAKLLRTHIPINKIFDGPQDDVVYSFMESKETGQYYSFDLGTIKTQARNFIIYDCLMNSKQAPYIITDIMNPQNFLKIFSCQYGPYPLVDSEPYGYTYESQYYDVINGPYNDPYVGYNTEIDDIFVGHNSEGLLTSSQNGNSNAQPFIENNKSIIKNCHISYSIVDEKFYFNHNFSYHTRNSSGTWILRDTKKKILDIPALRGFTNTGVKYETSFAGFDLDKISGAVDYYVENSNSIPKLKWLHWSSDPREPK